MRRLRDADGTPTHKRAAVYHVGALAAEGGEAHRQLQAEMAALLAALITKARAVEDAEDATVTAQALEDHHELILENLIRDLDADLGKLDRTDATLNARSIVFPDGFGKEIEPEGDAQLVVLPDLRHRISKFANHGIVAEYLTKFDAAATALKNAVAATNAAGTHADELFAAETDARRAIREQFEDAYGRLRALYKSSPGKAENFFLRERSRRPAKSG